MLKTIKYSTNNYKSMQEQISQKKTLSFEDINPEWSDIITNNGGFIKARNNTFESEDGKIRDIGVCSKCIVGEGHGY